MSSDRPRLVRRARPLSFVNVSSSPLTLSSIFLFPPRKSVVYMFVFAGALCPLSGQKGAWAGVYGTGSQGRERLIA